MKKIEQIALKAAKKAGAALLKEFNQFDRSKIKFKHKHEIVTEADLMSEKIILSQIKLNFPNHRILSEESGEVGSKLQGNGFKDNEYLWVIDPLDGTTNFSMHHPLWSISIAVVFKSEVVFALIYAPFLKEIYSAKRNEGAYLNGKKIKVSGIKGRGELNTFCHGKKNEHIERALAYYTNQKLKGFDCRQLGSAAIELGFVACGRTESIIVPGANSWDVAAGALIVKEAGGKVTDFNGKKWTLESKDILASNNLVHSNLLKVIR